jgi:hypothetical protein
LILLLNGINGSITSKDLYGIIDNKQDCTEPSGFASFQTRFILVYKVLFKLEMSFVSMRFRIYNCIFNGTERHKSNIVTVKKFLQ